MCNNKNCLHVCKRKFMQDHLKICTYAPQKCPCCADLIHKDSMHQHFEDKHKARFSYITTNVETGVNGTIMAYSCPTNDFKNNNFLSWKPQIAIMDSEIHGKLMILVQVKTTNNNFEVHACHLNSPLQTGHLSCEIRAWLPQSMECIFSSRIFAFSKYEFEPYLMFSKSFADVSDAERNMKLCVQLRALKMS